MPSLIAPYTLPSENTTEAQLSQNFSQMYILMGKVLYSRNKCCNNQLKTISFPDNSFFQVHSHFSRIFNKIIKFQYFSRTGKTVVIFPGFPGAVGTLKILPHACPPPPPTGPNSFVFTYIFTESAHIEGPRPTPTRNPGSAPDFITIFKIMDRVQRLFFKLVIYLISTEFIDLLCPIISPSEFPASAANT